MSTLVKRAQRPVADCDPQNGKTYLTEADYDQIADELLAAHPTGEDLWQLAYGWLIWKPEVAHVEERLATPQGWQIVLRTKSKQNEPRTAALRR